MDPTPVAPKPPISLNLAFLIITLVSLLLSTFFIYQNWRLNQKLNVLIKSQPTPTPSVANPPLAETPTIDPTANWKTYKYQQVFEIKVPNDLKIIDTGRIEIGDHLSIGTYPSNPENCRGDCSIIETKVSKTINGLEVRYLTGWWGEIGGNIAQSYIEYLIPQGGKYIYLQMQELPFSTKTSLVREKVGKVSEENSKLLDQILSTFKFTDGSNTTPIIVSSSKYRYSLEIPSDWTKLAGPPENETLFNFRKGDFEIGLSIIPTTSNTIQSYLQLADQESQTAWEGQPSIKVISTKLTKINAYSVVRREENWLAAAFAKPVVNTYFLYQGNIYSITLKYLGSVSNPTVTEETVYNQALSTFRFNQ